MVEMYGASESEFVPIMTKVFNKNDRPIYYEDSDGDWEKREYDQYGNKIYYENSDGYWYKKEYDTNGKLIYYEDSNGNIIDNR